MGVKLEWLDENIVTFQCPGCKESHVVRVRGESPWGWNNSMESPTFTPSILVNRGRSNPTAEVCHTYVTDGKIMFLGDCSHALAGQTVDMPDWFSDYIE